MKRRPIFCTAKRGSGRQKFETIWADLRLRYSRANHSKHKQRAHVKLSNVCTGCTCWKRKPHPPHRGRFQILCNDLHEGLGQHHSPPFCPINASIAIPNGKGEIKQVAAQGQFFFFLSTCLCICKEGACLPRNCGHSWILAGDSSQPLICTTFQILCKILCKQAPQAGLAEDGRCSSDSGPQWLRPLLHVAKLLQSAYQQSMQHYTMAWFMKWTKQRRTNEFRNKVAEEAWNSTGKQNFAECRPISPWD